MRNLSNGAKKLCLTSVVLCLALSSVMAWPTKAKEDTSSGQSQEKQTLLGQWENSTAVSKEQKEISADSEAYINATIAEIDTELKSSKKSAKDLQTAYDKLKDKYTEQSEAMAAADRPIKPYVQGGVSYSFDQKAGMSIGGGAIIKDNLMLGVEVENKDISDWKEKGNYKVSAKVGWIF